MHTSGSTTDLLPVVRHDLRALGEYLASFITFNPHPLAISGCDDTLRHTLAWLDAHTRDRSVWLRYLHARQAYCDCEVLLRVAVLLPSRVPSIGALPVTLRAG